MLSAPERVYSVTKKELLAVVLGLKYFRQYLISHKFVICTDHAAIQWIRRTPEPMAQAGRWLAIMEEFDFTVQHRAGSKDQNADALSRHPVAEVESHVVDTSCPDPESNDASVCECVDFVLLVIQIIIQAKRILVMRLRTRPSLLVYRRCGMYIPVVKWQNCRETTLILVPY